MKLSASHITNSVRSASEHGAELPASEYSAIWTPGRTLASEHSAASTPAEHEFERQADEAQRLAEHERQGLSASSAASSAAWPTNMSSGVWYLFQKDGKVSLRRAPGLGARRRASGLRLRRRNAGFRHGAELL